MKFWQWFKKKPVRKQSTFLYCPRCNEELISSNSFVEDVDGKVTYKCTTCLLQSEWLFDVAPVPILVEAKK